MTPTSYNSSINQQNPGEVSSTPQFGVDVPPIYLEGIVEDVITNEQHDDYGETGANVGLARIRVTPSDIYRDSDGLLEAMPANPFIQAPPLIGEKVQIILGAGRPMYSVSLNLTNKVGEQTFPNLSKVYGPPITGQERTEAAQRAAQGIEPYTPTTPGVPTNQTFGKVLRRLNPFAKKLRAEEGDVLIMGRFGNAIRMGSSLLRHPTAEVPEPNILLTAGQWPDPAALSTPTLTPHSLTFENINDDKSSIWMVANQEVDFQASTIHEDFSDRELHAHLRKSELAPDRPQPQYTGAQIFITSDRVVLNSKRNQISLFSKSEINLSARKSITIDTEKTAFITANEDVIIEAKDRLTLKAKNISFINTQDLAYGTAGDYVIVGKNVFIGKRDNSQPMVLGASLAMWLQDFMDLFIVDLSLIVAQPQQFILKLISLRRKLGSLPPGTPESPARLLDAAGATFNSTSNFVSLTNLGSDATA